ncbi:MAG: TM2 domain-containing protein [Acinetobacter sp.]
MLSEKVKSLFVQTLNEKFDVISRVQSEYDFAAGSYTVFVFSPMSGAKQILLKSKDEQAAEQAEKEYREVLEEGFLIEQSAFDVAEFIFDAWKAESAIKVQKNQDEISITEFIISKNIKFGYHSENDVMRELNELYKAHLEDIQMESEMEQFEKGNVRVLNGKKFVRVPSTKSSNVAGVLALLFGGLGIHRFYLGQVGMGILMILVTCVCMFTGFFLVPVIWWIIDAVMLFMANPEDFANKHAQWVRADNIDVKIEVENKAGFLNAK